MGGCQKLGLRGRTDKGTGRDLAGDRIVVSFDCGGSYPRCIWTPGLPELFTEMNKLHFNKSNSLQEKRQRIYIRSAVHAIYLTTTALTSRCYPIQVYTLVAVAGSPIWSQSTETQQVLLQSPSKEEVWGLVTCAGPFQLVVFSAGFPTPWHTTLPLHENGRQGFILVSAPWQAGSPGPSLNA